MPAVVRIVLVAVLVSAGLAVPAPAAPDDVDARVSERTIEARQRFFGKDNVDARTGEVRSDRVILSWFGVASYAAAIGGHVVLLDAWVLRGWENAPTTVKEVAALRPEAIFVGHANFDHAADIGALVRKTGAAVVGTPEQCEFAREQAGEDVRVRCVDTVPAEALPGVFSELSILPGVGISAVKHVHSAAELPDPSDPRIPCPPPPMPPHDTTTTAEEWENVIRHAADPQHGNMLYQFRVGDFSFVWHDTAGPIDRDAPQVIKVLERLPETDVQIGAVAAFGMVTNGMRSLGVYMRSLEPQLFSPNHHDNFFPTLGTRDEYFKPCVERELQEIPKKNRPRLHWTTEPEDYVNPDALTFEIADEAWR